MNIDMCAVLDAIAQVSRDQALDRKMARDVKEEDYRKTRIKNPQGVVNWGVNRLWTGNALETKPRQSTNLVNIARLMDGLKINKTEQTEILGKIWTSKTRNQRIAATLQVLQEMLTDRRALKNIS